MKLKTKAHTILSISVLLFIIANTVIFITVTKIPHDITSGFVRLSLICLVLQVVILNILFTPIINFYKTDIPELNNNPEGYKLYIDKLGSAPAKALVFFLFLSISVLVAFNIYLKSRGVDSGTVNAYSGLMLGISMVSSAFMYVLFDRLVSICLLNNGVNDYPDGIKSNRQMVKSLIIPTFISVMSTLCTFFLLFLSLTHVPPGTVDILSYVVKSTLPPLVIIVLIITVLVVLWSNSTHDLFKNINDTLELMTSKDKDLTTRITISSVDELGLISHRVNRFSDIINEHMEETKKMVYEQNKHQEELFKSIVNATENIHEIDDKINETISLVEQNDNIVTLTLTTGKELIKNSNDVATQVDIQTNNVAESSAAVEEMIASVKEVTKRTSIVKERTSVLSEDFTNGQQKINSTIESVNNVVVLSKSLIDINKIITGIAARTNLLAMNAAIEAAHAGEAGKGFSVVAQEIRKLAENTAQQTKTSSENLNKVLDEINTSVAIATETGKTFEKMKSSLSVVENETFSITEAMYEHDKANNEVLEQLTSTNDLAIKLNEISSKLIYQGNSMLEYLEQLEESSHKSLKNARDIKEFNEMVTHAMQDLNELSISTEENNKKTLDLVNSFNLK